MKKILFSTTFLMLVFISFGQKSEDCNTLKDLNIKLIMSSTVVIRNGLIDMSDCQSSMEILNENGQVTESRMMNIKSNQTTIYNYQYGKCTDYKDWKWSNESDGKFYIVQNQHIVFDDDCKIKKVIWTDSLDRMTSTLTNEYNEKQKVALEITRNNRNETTSTIYYTYPEDSIIEKKAFLTDRSFWYHTQEHFDKKGNKTATISFDAEGKITESAKTEYVYKDGKIIEEVNYTDKGKFKEKSVFTYNTDGLVERIIENSTNEDCDVETITVTKYIKPKY
jgi:hypothetical protein